MTHGRSPDGSRSKWANAFHGRAHVRSNVERSVGLYSHLSGTLANQGIVPANLLLVMVVLDDETPGLSKDLVTVFVVGSF